MSLSRSSSIASIPIWDSGDPARNPPPLPLPASPKHKELSPFPHDSLESPTRQHHGHVARHARTESMKLDQLYFARQHRHTQSASMSRMSSTTTAASTAGSPSLGGQSPLLAFSASSTYGQPDISSMSDQLNTISTTATTILTTLQNLMRRSKDNATELEGLKKQVLESTERDFQTVDEIKRLLSSSNTSTDLSALYEKLDSLRPAQAPPAPAAPPPPPPPQPIVSSHKLDEEKKVVDDILISANQALTHLLTLTDIINNLTSHLEGNTTRLAADESRLQALQSQKSALEAECARLEATIHLRNLELASFTTKTDVLESRILRAKTAIQLSGSNHVKMKKSAVILGPEGVMAQASPKKVSTPREIPVTPQRRILSLSSTSNKPSPRMAEFSASTTGGGTRKTSWGKRLGGMLSGLTSSSASNKENDSGSMRSGKSQMSGAGVEIFGLGIPPVPVRGRSVSQMTK